MNAQRIIAEVISQGGEIRIAGDKLKLSAPAPLPDDLMTLIRAHKSEIMAALQNDASQAAAEAAEERAAILEHDGGLFRTQADEVAALAEAFYAHLWGIAKQTGCCHAPAGRYCPDGQRRKNAYDKACH